jgi:hypothetical protein
VASRVPSTVDRRPSTVGERRFVEVPSGVKESQHIASALLLTRLRSCGPLGVSSLGDV